MKILILTNHYLPGYKAGGPIKSVSSLCINLQNNFDITVLTSDHDFGDTKPYENIELDQYVNIDKYKTIYLSKISFESIKKNIYLIQPDVIYLNSFFSKMTQIVLLLKKLGIVKSKIIVAPRGELSSGALSIKSKKKNLFLKVLKFGNFISKDLVFHSTDFIESKDIKKLFVNKIVQIPNLTSIISNIEIIEKKEDELRIVFLSRISSKKNLLFALEILQGMDESNVVFDIYGTKEDIPYWNDCEKSITSFRNIRVRYKGSLNPTEITKSLAQYHVFFLPTLNENFGHAIVEAMQVGLIPVISDQTPWNDLSKHNAGWALSLGNNQSFIDAIKEIKDMNNDLFVEISSNVKKYIVEKLDNEKSIKMHKQMFEEVIK